MRQSSILFILFPALLFAGTDVPRFEDYPAPTDWHGPAASIKLITRSERMFRTRLIEAARESPDFAGHYKFAGWGCGSVCGAGAIIDLQSGDVYAPPLGGKGEGWERWISCPALFDGTGYEYHLNSRLMVVRCGWNFDQDGKNWPDLYYLLWEGTKFKELLHVPQKRLNDSGKNLSKEKLP
jgi:hypothetical protein